MDSTTIQAVKIDRLQGHRLSPLKRPFASLPIAERWELRQDVAAPKSLCSPPVHCTVIDLARIFELSQAWQPRLPASTTATTALWY
jgi:hypothetical protein